MACQDRTAFANLDASSSAAGGNRDLHFIPQLKVLDRVVLQIYGDLADRGYDFLQEDLQDGVWSGESAAHLSGLVQQVLVLVLQALRLGFADILRPLIR